MHFVPDLYADDYSDDDDDLDDGFQLGSNDEFREQLRNAQLEARIKEENSEEFQKKRRLDNIYSAISYRRNNLLVEELEKGLDVDVDLQQGWTPLLLAASVANEEAAEELLKRFANPNKSRDGITPLMYACQGNVEKNPLPVVKLLVKYKADVKAIDLKRKNAFMLAAYFGYLDVVEFLMPLVDIHAEDNQRWTALFWAVDGNQKEVVKFLLEQDYDLNKVDVRGNTILSMATQNQSLKVLEVIPQEECAQKSYGMHSANSYLEFEDHFKGLKKGQKPQFFKDVLNIMYGTRNEGLADLMYENQVDLYRILSATDSELKELGVAMPYQRNRILGGLYKFHKHPYHPKSIRVVAKNDIFCNLDVASNVLTIIKQLITMEACLSFMTKNSEERLNAKESKELMITITKLKDQLDRVENVSQVLLQKSKEWDATVKPADLIQKQPKKFPWAFVLISASATSLCAYYFYKSKLT